MVGSQLRTRLSLHEDKIVTERLLLAEHFFAVHANYAVQRLGSPES